MSHLQPWQRTVYFLGEAVMVAGLLWLLYNFFFVKACPTGPFNYLTLILAGLTLSILPLHPFGSRLYYSSSLQRAPFAAVLWWLIALTGLGYVLFRSFTSFVVIDYIWVTALMPAVLYFWFAIPSKLGDKPMPPPKAPPPSVSGDAADSELPDDVDLTETDNAKEMSKPDDGGN
jgi:hypothetical protein